MTFEAGTKVGKIAATVPQSIRIFEQWGVDYCCGGDTTLGDACAKIGVTVQEFEASLATLPSYTNEEKSWVGEALTGFLISRYHDYTRAELALTEDLARKVVDAHGHRHPELSDLQLLLRKLADDLLPHMLKEEQVLFPYVGLLEDAKANAKPAPTPFFGTVRNPVRRMMMEHDAAGELLGTMREVTSGYVIPSDACASYTELYHRLETLERVTHEHIHLENNVLFPRAVELEGPVSEKFAEHACCGGSCSE